MTPAAWWYLEDSSLLTGVEASAAQNAPVTTTCSQCGAILPSSVRACNFCDSILSSSASSAEKEAASRARGGISLSVDAGAGSTPDGDRGSAWRGELEQRLGAYRARRGGAASRAEQSRLPFGEPSSETRFTNSIGLADPAAYPETADDDFSFTIAIGRYTPSPEKRDGRLVIDVSIPPGAETDETEATYAKHYGLYPVASLEERRWSAIVDVACLLFAYGGFLTLFSSLGGQFTLSKLTAEVYAATLTIVYLQYFALFTVFGGTTPGMMFRGLQVSSFSGEPPSPRQMLLRSLGYMISAATLFMGFIWAWWDEDALTWHDRISHTYLTSPETRAHMNSATAAHSR